MRKPTYNLENSKQSVANACNREQNNHNQTQTSKTDNTQLRKPTKMLEQVANACQIDPKTHKSHR